MLVIQQDGETCLHVAVENASVEVCAILHRYEDYIDEAKGNGVSIYFILCYYFFTFISFIHFIYSCII